MLNHIDIHSHLNLKPLLDDQEGVILRMRNANIGAVTVGVDYKTSKIALDLANENPDILWVTVGQHPNDNLDEVFDYEKPHPDCRLDADQQLPKEYQGFHLLNLRLF